MLLVDFQAGLGFGVESIPRQLVVNNAVGLARTAVAFKVPVIASTSASTGNEFLPLQNWLNRRMACRLPLRRSSPDQHASRQCLIS
jgi:Amidases related to nicotinamidase